MISPQEIKSFAQTLGFDAVGIAKAYSVPEAEEALQDWIEAGYHGGMQYLADYRERLARLASSLPNAKSVIVLGVNYFSHDSRPRNPGRAAGLKGRVARYAWGRDYHHVIKDRLKKMESLILERCPGASCLSCVDTQPLLERSYAERAGLGFRGRQAILLNRHFGPWLFLSEILTDLELEPDHPEDHGTCGTCTACIDRCPTRAILPSGTIDARRCISYLTIEHKGVIPRELRPLMKNWVFGCDECLAVCPFTRVSKETSWEELGPEAGAGVGRELDLEAVFQIRSNGEYERRFKGTALLRASRAMMLRNAAVVLGNIGGAEAVPWLRDALERESVLVRIHAAWALGRIGGDRACEILQERLAEESDAAVREEIVLALRDAVSDGVR